MDVALCFATDRVDGSIMPAQVVAQAVQLDGPNRVVVSGVAEGNDEHLVVLMSDYPGWRLRVDGERAEMASVNGYLGAEMLPGEHSYVFSFRPIQHDIGLGISLLTLLFCLWWVGSGRKSPVPQTEPPASSLS
ncbi:MAG: hypothetical protein IPL78_09195 [Chloroflexi bacterium]|nr:hypothetical protein [Chloroflexota bacterium]